MAYRTALKISRTFPKRVNDVTHLDNLGSLHCSSHRDEECEWENTLSASEDAFPDDMPAPVSCALCGCIECKAELGLSQLE